MNSSQSSNATFPCPLRASLGCTGTFSRQQDAERHVIEYHGPSSSCQIPGCSYTTKRRYRLRAHVESVHGIGEDLVRITPTIVTNCTFTGGANIYRGPGANTLGGLSGSEVALAPVQDLGENAFADLPAFYRK